MNSMQERGQKKEGTKRPRREVDGPRSDFVTGTNSGGWYRCSEVVVCLEPTTLAKM